MSVRSFFIFFFNLVSINYTEWSIIPARPSLMCSFNRGNIEGNNSSKIVSDVYVYMFYVCEVISFVDCLDRELIYMT